MKPVAAPPRAAPPGPSRGGPHAGGWGQQMARWRVPMGFVAAAAYVSFARPTPLSLALGLPLAAAGLAWRAAASGHIRKNDALATTGPYRHCRNPLYLGSAVLAGGFLLAAANPWLAIAAALAFAAIYTPVIRREEAFLAARFGPAFAAYCREVPPFVPRFWSRRARVQASAAGGSGFSLALYRRHREYQALAGYAAITAILLVKMLFLQPGPPWH